MSCFYRYYYKLKECGTSTIIETDSFELRKYDIGCIILDQLTSTCYELIEISSTVYHAGVITPIQFNECLVYTDCTECIEKVLSKKGCLVKDSCNYDPCATWNSSIPGDPAIPCVDAEITFQIGCLDGYVTCADPDCS